MTEGIGENGEYHISYSEERKWVASTVKTSGHPLTNLELRIVPTLGVTGGASSINEPTLKGNCRDRGRSRGVLRRRRRRRPPHPLSQSPGRSVGRSVCPESGVHPVIIEPLEELTNDLRHAADADQETTRNANSRSVTSISGLWRRREISPFK